MDSIVHPKLAAHFRAAKAARLLAVTNVDGAGSGWLVLRLLGDWLRLCVAGISEKSDVSEKSDKSDMAVVVFSLYRDFDFYAAGLTPLGIDLKRHEARGHVRFFGGMYDKILGENPSLTLDAALDLLSDEADRLKQDYARTILVLDAPELAMTLVGDNPLAADAAWVELFQGVTNQFHHAIVAMSLDSPRMGRSRHEFEQSMARISGVKALAYHADMTMVLRRYQTHNSKTDGTLRIAYARPFEPPTPDIRVAEETFGYQILADGRSVTIHGGSTV